jgi:origin recognition complex subunit 1
LIDRHEDSIVDTSDAPNMFSDELVAKENKKNTGLVKRDYISKPQNFGPITDINNGEQEKQMVYDNPYDLLLSKLQLNFVPDSLPCRESEKEVIREFVMSGLRNRGSSTSLYISGMPGTGKTATTLEVIKSLNRERKKKFKFIHVNGMQLNNSSVMYSLIYKEITGQKHKPTTAAVMLDDYFKKKDLSENQLKNQEMIVLLVDELDALVTKKQTLLYNLFDWPSNKNSGLIILAIANTMDLPERFLVKIKSRIGESRLVYQPYSRPQIEKIIKSRLTDKDIFNPDCIKMVSTKIASLSGDIRRALQVCRRATELAKSSWIKTRRVKGDNAEITRVDINKVQTAFIELYQSKNTLLLKALRKYEKLVIMAVMTECKAKYQEKVKLSDIVTRVTGMSGGLSYDRLTQGEIMEILLRMKSFGIVSITNEKPKLDNIHIQPFVYIDEIITAYETE